jgi:citrate synthase
MPALQMDKDLSWNFANQIGFGGSEGFVDLIRLYNALHTDHEGGNVSAHATRTFRRVLLARPSLADAASPHPPR